LCPPRKRTAGFVTGKERTVDLQPISREGWDKVKAEIAQLEDQLADVSEKVKIAREEGDLSENAEYHGQKETQGMIQAKINQLKGKLSGCRIVDAGDMPKGIVGFGSRITVRDLSDGMEEKYELVGPGEEDYEGEIMKILTSSPLADGMVGKKVGERAEVETPNGTIEYEIVEIIDPG
jgi:transcription elongation factor GreA